MTAFAFGFVVACVYGSFFEWWLHKHVMHNKRWKIAYERHAIKHHHEHATLISFYKPKESRWPTLGESAIPIAGIIHVVILAVLGWLLGPWLYAGAAAGCVVYLALYELFHDRMHAIPNRFWFQRTWGFRCIEELHRIHHLWDDRNLNVVLPLADLVLGTLSLQELKAERNGPQDQTGPLSVLPHWVKRWLTPQVVAWCGRNVPTTPVRAR